MLQLCDIVRVQVGDFSYGEDVSKRFYSGMPPYFSVCDRANATYALPVRFLETGDISATKRSSELPASLQVHMSMPGLLEAEGCTYTLCSRSSKRCRRPSSIVEHIPIVWLVFDGERGRGGSSSRWEWGASTFSRSSARRFVTSASTALAIYRRPFSGSE